MPNRTTLITFLLLTTLFAVINFAMIWPYLLAVLVGAILALLTKPAYRWLRGHGLGPKTSAAGITLLTLLLVILPLALFTFVATKQGIALADTLVNYPGFSFEALLKKAESYGPVETLFGNGKDLETRVRAGINTLGKAATGTVVAIASALPDLMLQSALALIAMFFLLMDGGHFLYWLRDKIPLEPDVRERLYRSIQDTAISTTWATIWAAAAQAAVMFVAFIVLSVPAAFLAAGATFIFAWVPLLGSLPVWAAGAAYLFISGEVVKGVLMIVFGLFTSVVDNFVRPLVLKGRSDMHPLVAFVAIFGGIQMFGLFGVFFGPILAAILIALLQIWPIVGERFGLLKPSDTLSLPPNVEARA